MTKEVVWTWSAEADLQDLFQRADSASPNGGLSLLIQIEAATKMLSVFPLLAPEWNLSIRRLLIQKANLGLFYVPEPRGIVVIGLADLRQHPDGIAEQILRRLP